MGPDESGGGASNALKLGGVELELGVGNKDAAVGAGRVFAPDKEALDGLALRVCGGVEDALSFPLETGPITIGDANPEVSKSKDRLDPAPEPKREALNGCGAPLDGSAILEAYTLLFQDNFAYLRKLASRGFPQSVVAWLQYVPRRVLRSGFLQVLLEEGTVSAREPSAFTYINT